MDAKRARVYRATDSALTGPSSATPAVVVGRFLRERGQSAATVASLREVAQYRSPVTGLTHIRMEQEVAGMRVADAYVKAALNRQGELVHLIQNLAVVKPGVAAARATERQALRAALAHLYPGSKEDPAVVGRQGNITTFARSPTFYAAPTVERVALLMSSGALKTGFLVETWKDRGNLLHNTLVDGSGRVLATELRTNTDSYNIFPDHPGNSTQTVVAGPGAGNAESPSGWLFAGTHSSIHIAGNNASAYLDRDNDNAPDPGGDPISTGDFLSVADLGTAPTTATNQNVAVQNLFYMNNLTHDILYRHGFVEGAGNFQENNFGMGGRGGDPVNAEAQDGGGTDNANFATPRDGRNPRMQMYLWTGRGIDQVVVGATTYMAEGAAFGPPLTPGGITAVIVEVSDGTGTLTDGCEAFSGVSGQIALIDRGTCSFVTKVRNAQTAGALAVIVANNVATSPFTMGDDGTGGDITIPAVMVSQADGLAIKVGLPGSGTVRQTTPPPLQIDGDLDSDIIYHEYGHGLTWRMVGRMSGSLSGAIGEGMSDVLSVLFNEDDAVGEYSFSDPIGIRTARYTGYPRTYGDIVGTEVHLDGEVYGAIGWRLFENFQAAGVPKDTLLDYLVDGMNYTPAGPSFEEMRDGILQSVANSGNPHACLVWDAFADYGVGVGAQGRTRGANVLVTESFVLPPECAGP